MGFDPRGIGARSSITCFTDSGQNVLFARDSKPDNEAEFAQALIDMQNFINRCLAKTANLAHFSTTDTARDMERLCQRLDDEKLNYMGFSYGTYPGTLYAQRFPNNIGRFVLDGAINPSISIAQQTLIQAVAFNQALANFIVDCAQDKNRPLPTNVMPVFFTELSSKVVAKTFNNHLR